MSSDEDVSRMATDYEGNSTFALPSNEDELVSSVNLSSDSVFFPRTHSSSFMTSTPSRSRSVRGAVRAGALRARTLAGAPGETHKCHVCGRHIKTKKGFDKCVLNHKMEEAAIRRPSRDKLLDECVKITQTVVTSMVETPVGETAQASASVNYVKEVQSKSNSPEFAHFMKSLSEPLMAVFCNPSSRVILLSSIRTEVRKTLFSTLTAESVRTARMAKLQLVKADEGEENASRFLGLFCLKMCTPTAAFLIQEMREVRDDPHIVKSSQFSSDDFNTLFYQQTLHRVVGCKMKGVLRRARQFSASKRWTKFREVILGRLARIGTCEPNPSSKDYWTALLARKSLTFVNDETLSFFVEVAKVICYSESADGSLSKEHILTQVTSSPSLMAKWGTVLGNALDEHDSTYLMRLLVLSLCGTFGVGIMQKRMNQQAAVKKGLKITSVGLRGRLTR